MTGSILHTIGCWPERWKPQWDGKLATCLCILIDCSSIRNISVFWKDNFIHFYWRPSKLHFGIYSFQHESPLQSQKSAGYFRHSLAATPFRSQLEAKRRASTRNMPGLCFLHVVITVSLGIIMGYHFHPSLGGLQPNLWALFLNFGLQLSGKTSAHSYKTSGYLHIPL